MNSSTDSHQLMVEEIMKSGLLTDPPIVITHKTAWPHTLAIEIPNDHQLSTKETQATAWPNTKMDESKRKLLQYRKCEDCNIMAWCEQQPDEDEEDEETEEIEFIPGEWVCEECYYEAFL